MFTHQTTRHSIRGRTYRTDALVYNRNIVKPYEEQLTKVNIYRTEQEEVAVGMEIVYDFLYPFIIIIFFFFRREDVFIKLVMTNARIIRWR